MFSPFGRERERDESESDGKGARPGILKTLLCVNKWGQARGEEDNSSKLVSLHECSSGRSAGSPDGPAKHKIWDLGLGEGRVGIRAFNTTHRIVETI